MIFWGILPMCSNQSIYWYLVILLVTYFLCESQWSIVLFCSQQNVRQLLKTRRHVCILLVHWLMHAYGLLAVTELRQPSVHGPLFVLVLAPTLFYLGTTSLTDPGKFTTWQQQPDRIDHVRLWSPAQPLGSPGRETLDPNVSRPGGSAGG